MGPCQGVSYQYFCHATGLEKGLPMRYQEGQDEAVIVLLIVVVANANIDQVACLNVDFSFVTPAVAKEKACLCSPHVP